MKAKTLLEVLEDKFLVDDGCWNWTASINSSGYGNLAIKRRTKSAHRVMYELLVGPIPDGLEIDHLCRNRACVNPAHLEPVTKQTNVLRGESLSARQARRTHCDHGHEFTAHNTIRRPGEPNRRRCRICVNIAQLKVYYRHKAERAKTG